MIVGGILLGIDIGGSAIKGSPVDVHAGRLTEQRVRHPTPEPATPDAVADTVTALVGRFPLKGPIGCTFPGVIKHGSVCTAVNLDPAWVGMDIDGLLTERTGRPVTVMNDADAAGLAEVTFGAGRDRRDLVLMLTLGTGIGSALFHDGRLVPNTELGHLSLRGQDAETLAAARIKDEQDLTWEAYAELVNGYLQLVETVLWPDLIIIGGGISADHAQWFHLLRTRAELRPAQLANNAGIIGAARWVAEQRP
ncbi:MAG: polyphosphate--glucose phosphotransferase [Acidimicrobiales bacterium]